MKSHILSIGLKLILLSMAYSYLINSYGKEGAYMTFILFICVFIDDVVGNPAGEGLS